MLLQRSRKGGPENRGPLIFFGVSHLMLHNHCVLPYLAATNIINRIGLLIIHILHVNYPDYGESNPTVSTTFNPEKKFHGSWRAITRYKDRHSGLPDMLSVRFDIESITDISSMLHSLSK